MLCGIEVYHDIMQNFLIPGAIVLAGLILAGAVYLVRGGGAGGTLSAGNPSAVRSVSPSDHILGNPEARVIVVEYSDIDCPYCKDFQKTMHRIMSDYGPKGEIAWVYRHFPLTVLHKNAAKHAEAAECAALEGGNEAFFAFIDAIHEASPDRNQFNPDNYGAIATKIGIDAAKLAVCLAEGTFAARVAEDAKNAADAGGNGTPYTVLITDGVPSVPIAGAVPYEALVEVIDRALSGTN